MTDYAKEIVILPDPAALAAAAADQFVQLAQAAVEKNGRFSVALAGGSTPQGTYRLLAQPPRKALVDWSSVHVFWGDERFVPPDNPDNLWRMAQETFLADVPIPAANIYPMPTVGLTPEAAAAQYAQTLTDFFAPGPVRFDLILLGMGDDGHTASLFPGKPSLRETKLVVSVQNAPKPPPTRLTLTYTAINQAANVLFLVTGKDKATAVAQVLGSGPSESKMINWPARGVVLENGRLLWLLDQAAAKKVA